MPKRRRYMRRDELVAEISATHDLNHEQIDQVLNALAAMGVQIDALVRFEVDEPTPDVC